MPFDSGQAVREIPPPPSPSKCARALAISLLAIGLLAVLGAAAFGIAAIATLNPLFLIGAFGCTTVSIAAGGFFCCRCCQVGPAWNVRRQFTRLPPTSPLHERPPVNFRSPVIVPERV